MEAESRPKCLWKGAAHPTTTMTGLEGDKSLNLNSVLKKRRHGLYNMREERRHNALIQSQHTLVNYN